MIERTNMIDRCDAALRQTTMTTFFPLLCVYCTCTTCAQLAPGYSETSRGRACAMARSSVAGSLTSILVVAALAVCFCPRGQLLRLHGTKVICRPSNIQVNKHPITKF